MSAQYATLQRPVELTGIGLHFGAQVVARLLPSDQLGISFARLDLAGAPEVAADLKNVVATVHATVLQNGDATVSTTEHLLAALWSQGITHCRVELNGPEVPILDGSSQPWLELLAAAGQQNLDGERPLLALTQPVIWADKGARMAGFPLATPQTARFELQVEVDFNHPHAGLQQIEIEVTPQTFKHELAVARTFTLEGWLEPLRQQGLIRGGNLENAILIGDDGPSSPWRIDNELVRHKALDLIGDLALLLAPSGARFGGRIEAQKAGHGVHRAWMELAQESGAFSFPSETSSKIEFS